MGKSNGILRYDNLVTCSSPLEFWKEFARSCALVKVVDYQNVVVGIIAGHDYPRPYREFMKMFFDDKACAVYLERPHRPDGFICQTCFMPMAL